MMSTNQFYQASTPPHAYLAQPQQHQQQIGKPALKLLLAQQTAKPDAAARSPPITSNCQSQSSIITTHTKGSPKSSLSTNTNRQQKTKNIYNSLGQLLQQSSTMFQKQQAVQSANQILPTLKPQQPQQQRLLPKPRKYTGTSSQTATAGVTGTQIAHKNTFQAFRLQQSQKSVTQGGLGSNQQPRVGRQLSDLLHQYDGTGEGCRKNKPSLTGDIDDVANLVTPSPRRNPGKVHSNPNDKSKFQAAKVAKMTTEEQEGDSMAILDDECGDDTPVNEHEHHSASMGQGQKYLPSKLQQQKLAPMDSFDEGVSVNEFNQHLHGHQFAPLEEKKARGPPSQPIVKSMSSQNRHGTQLAATTAQAKQAQNLVGVKRQVPLQSSIETKKAQSKHPNTKAMKTFQSVRATNGRGLVEPVASSIQKTPKLFPTKTSKAAGKAGGVGLDKHNSLAQSTLNQQSCDVIVSTEGNVSNIVQICETQATGEHIQKSALTVFGPEDRSSAAAVEDELNNDELVEMDLSKASLTATNSKRLVKVMPPPKQIEIELGFEVSAGIQPSNSYSRISTVRSAGLRPKASKPQAQVLGSFRVSTREVPLEEHAPNSAVQNGSNQKQKLTMAQYNKDLERESKQEIANTSLKLKCRQKALNNTMSERQAKQHQTIANSTKIQAVPTLNLNSFKSRPKAPVTSRNLSQQTSLVKKSQQSHGRITHLGHRQGTKEDAAGKLKMKLDNSPPNPEMKTLESLSKPSDLKQRMMVTQTSTKAKAKGSSVKQTIGSANTKKIKGSTSSSVDARQQFGRPGRAFLVSEGLSQHLNDNPDSQEASHVQQQANISIDLTMQNNEASLRDSKPQQYKTESLERILGPQAESYFRQIERTIQMAPVNVSASQNRSQRQASHSQSSRLSGRTGKDSNMQTISLTMPGIAEFKTSKNYEKQKKQSYLRSQISGSTNKQPKLISNALILEPRLASADKKSSTLLEINHMNVLHLSHHQNKSIGHQTMNNSASQARVELSRPSGFGTLNRDRFVAHRRIDLICDDNAIESGSAGLLPSANHNHSNISITMPPFKDGSTSSRSMMARGVGHQSQQQQRQKQKQLSFAGKQGHQQHQLRQKSESVLSAASESISQAQKLTINVSPQGGAVGEPRLTAIGPQSQVGITSGGCGNGKGSGKPGSAGLRNNHGAMGSTGGGGPMQRSGQAERNSKSSFSAAAERAATVAAVGNKQSIAKDWVICLPNEPPQVIESEAQEFNKQNQLKDDSSLFQVKSSKKDSSSCAAQTEMGGSTRGAKSLLHPSAQKKAQSRTSNIAASSKELTELQHQNKKTAQKIGAKNVNRSGVQTSGFTNSVAKKSNIVAQASRGSGISQPVKADDREAAGNPEVALQQSQKAKQNGDKALAVVEAPMQTQLAQTQPFSRKVTRKSSAGAGAGAGPSRLDQSSSMAGFWRQSEQQQQQQQRYQQHQSLLASESNKDQTSSHASLNKLAAATRAATNGNRLANKEDRALGDRGLQSEEKLWHSVASTSNANRTLRSSLNQITDRSNQQDLLLGTTDDEAAQYYEKLTSLFQETRQKLKEFNQDFSGSNRSNKKRSTHHSDKKRLLLDARSRKNEQQVSSQSALCMEDRQQLHRQSLNPHESLIEQLQKEKAPSTIELSSLSHKPGSSHWGSSSMLQPTRSKQAQKLDEGGPEGHYQKAKRQKSGGTKQAADSSSSAACLRIEKKRTMSGLRSHNLSQAYEESSISRAGEDQNNFVDVYYQTNNESLDFLVGSRAAQQSKRKEAAQMAHRESPYEKQGRQSLPLACREAQTSGQFHPRSQRQEGKQFSKRQNSGNNAQGKKQTGANGRNHDLNQARSQRTYAAGSASADQGPLASRRESQQDRSDQRNGTGQIPPTNATIYINNLMNGVQGSAADEPHLASQQQTMTGMPGDIMRSHTQSQQVLYPSASQQIFSTVQQQQQQANAAAAFANQLHMLQASQNPQQQIVFVPVPVLSTTPTQALQTAPGGIHTVPSAPQFLPSPHSQLTYRFPAQQAVFPYQQAPHQFSSQSRSPLYAQVSNQQAQQQQQYATMVDFSQVQSHHQMSLQQAAMHSNQQNPGAYFISHQPQDSRQANKRQQASLPTGSSNIQGPSHRNKNAPGHASRHNTQPQRDPFTKASTGQEKSKKVETSTAGSKTAASATAGSRGGENHQKSRQQQCHNCKEPLQKSGGGQNAHKHHH